ncbi:hypothetical protein GCM10020331_095240 [Ectobacillus funiculus]
MAEITAVGIYMQYWIPDIPRWIWSLAALLLMSLVNFLAVKAYGELEFWFALIKNRHNYFNDCVRCWNDYFFGFGNGGIATGIHNLWSHGGFFSRTV